MDKFNELVQKERIAQDKKWGVQDHHPAIWLAILIEEIGEASSEVIATEWKPELQCRCNLSKELIQVVAVVKAMWESGKRNGWL